MATLLNGSGEQQQQQHHKASIRRLRDSLRSESNPLALRFRALFALKHIASIKPSNEDSLEAVHAIAAAFTTPSALLKHELAYCLGQTANLACAPFLRERLEDAQEMAICRHEAAEALAALGDTDSLMLLKRIRDDEQEERVVRETCDIAVARLRWQQSNEQCREQLRDSDFTSVDPAPPLAEVAQSPSVAELEETLLDTTLPLFLRYRAMFSLRNLSSPPDLPTAVPAVLALARGLDDPSALFRHEVAFVFGQLAHPASIPSLFKTLSNTSEEGMVRHEAAEALGSLGTEDGVEDMLKQFLDDDEPVVRESIVVALDMAEYERNGDFEYASLPEVDGRMAAAQAIPAQ